MSRPKGAPNRQRTAFLRALREEYPDYDPLRSMAAAAMKLEKKAESQADWKMVVDAHDKVCQYLIPKLKSIEMDVTSDGEQLTMPDTIRLVAAATEKLLDREDAKSDD